LLGVPARCRLLDVEEILTDDAVAPADPVDAAARPVTEG